MKQKMFLYLGLVIAFSTLAFAQTINVTFKVNMNYKITTNVFKPATEQVKTVGTVQNPTWDPAGAPAMTDEDNDGIYEITYQLAPSTSFQYKFCIGDNWDKVELGMASRALTTGTEDMVLDAVWYNDEEPAGPGGENVMVTFRVNMSVKMKEGKFDPSVDVLRAVGEIQVDNPWSPELGTELTDMNGDSVYTCVYSIPNGTSYKYKFNIGNAWDGKEEQSERTLTLGVSGVVLPIVWYDNDSVVTTNGSGNYLFQCDMAGAGAVGLYDPLNDVLEIRGVFNAWTNTNADISIMSQNILDENIWEISIPFNDWPVGDEVPYKYYLDAAVPGFFTDSWEKPIVAGGGNRTLSFEAGDKIMEPMYFDGIKPEYVINNNSQLRAKFRVDMTAAASRPTNPFNPETDTVQWVCGSNSWLATQQMTSGDKPVFNLTREGNTMIFSGYLEDYFAPTFNGFLYNYQYVHNDGTGNFTTVNEVGGGPGVQFSYRLKWAHQSGPNTFVTSNYNMPLDAWTDEEDKRDQSQYDLDPYTVSADDIESLSAPDQYSLSQNYPNPFNPSTIINFNLPMSGSVSLKVFNVMGQEVAELINSELVKGNHKVQFNASNLGSGVYFYTLKTQNFTSTKRMVLVK